MSNDKLYLKVEYNVDDPISKDEAKGWVSGDFNDFLKLTPEETDQVNIQFLGSFGKAAQPDNARPVVSQGW
jgi:hypothetical protein